MTDPAARLIEARSTTRVINVTINRILNEIEAFPIDSMERKARIWVYRELIPYLPDLHAEEKVAQKALLKEIRYVPPVDTLREPTRAQVEELLQEDETATTPPTETSEARRRVLLKRLLGADRIDAVEALRHRRGLR